MSPVNFSVMSSVTHDRTCCFWPFTPVYSVLSKENDLLAGVTLAYAEGEEVNLQVNALQGPIDNWFPPTIGLGYQ